MAKNQFIRARVANWEKFVILENARKARMTENEFVRRAVLEKDVVVIDGAAELLTELRRRGNNLNQLVILARHRLHKTDGRGYYHIVQSFSPDDPLDFETTHEIGLKFAEYFQSYQCVVTTHMNIDHIHNHIIMNSVNFETGRKFHQSAREMQ